MSLEMENNIKVKIWKYMPFSVSAEKVLARFEPMISPTVVDCSTPEH